MQTVTVNAIAPRAQDATLYPQEQTAQHIARRQVQGMSHGTLTTYWPEPLPSTTPPPQMVALADRFDRFALCNFLIHRSAGDVGQYTDYACTLTRLEVFNGTLWTESVIASTSILLGQPLDFSPLLSIEDLWVTRRTDPGRPTIDQFPLTGNFTPTGTYTTSTTIYAYPSMSLSSVSSWRATFSGVVLPPPSMALIAASTPPESTIAPLGNRDISSSISYDVTLTTTITVSPSSTSHPPIATFYCNNIEEPPSEWTTSYLNAAWWILACEITPFPYGLAPFKRQERTVSNSRVNVITYTSMSYSYQPSTTIVAVPGHNFPTTVTTSVNGEKTVITVPRESLRIISEGTDTQSQKHASSVVSITTATHSVTVVVPTSTTIRPHASRSTETQTNAGVSLISPRVFVPVLSAALVITALL